MHKHKPHQLLSKQVLRKVKQFSNFITARQYLEIFGTVIVLLAILWITTLITPYHPKTEMRFYDKATNDSSLYYRAEIEDINFKEVKVRLLDGPNKEQTVVINYIESDHIKNYTKGNVVLVAETPESNAFSLIDKYRLPGLIWSVAIFVALVLLIGRRRGLTSLLGLAVSIMVIIWFIIPMIMAGRDAFWVSIAGAYMIAFSSIIIAHGLKVRTLISLGCVLAILTLIAIGAYFAVHLLGFSGLSDETTMYISLDNPQINLAGVLAGGIIIASLGVLDDIITAQVATVDELQKANPALSIRELYSRAASVGGEHIASLVNTLALVYVGAALPVIISLVSYNRNFLLLMNDEFLAVEIIRTVIASIGLVLAVPLSTIVAAYILRKRQHIDNGNKTN